LISADQESARNDAAFVASMKGLNALTLQAARELQPLGVQVHAVESGEGVVERVLALLEEKI